MSLFRTLTPPPPPSASQSPLLLFSSCTLMVIPIYNLDSTGPISGNRSYCFCSKNKTCSWLLLPLSSSLSTPMSSGNPCANDQFSSNKSKTTLSKTTFLNKCDQTTFLNKYDPFYQTLPFKCYTVLFSSRHCGCPLLPMSSSLSSPHTSPAVLLSSRVTICLKITSKKTLSIKDDLLK